MECKLFNWHFKHFFFVACFRLTIWNVNGQTENLYVVGGGGF
ncbi:hypothetical protein [Clostridioides difficile]